MSVLFIIVYIVLGLVATVSVANAIYCRAAYGLSWRDYTGLSAPSQRIVKAYRKLPSDSQVENPLPHLRALDKKYGVATVNARHRESMYDSSWFTWNRDSEYKDIFESIQGIAKAIHERNEKIRLAALEGDLADAATLAERYNEEAQLLRNVTKELT